ncbi:MAG: Vitamin K epoxide reductase [Gammaproteobacteria bacterium]|nr:Vitamin K epoxide reductase [Gammaproteobacteria bacterium]
MPKTHPKPKSLSRNSALAVAPRPDWSAAALACAGLLLTLYLLLGRGEGDLLGCPVGGGCDLVQRSRWSTFFGLPLAGIGAVMYAAILVVAIYGKAAAQRPQLILLVSGTGFGISLYLGLVTWRELGVLCPYCLVSLGLLGILAGLALWRCGIRTGVWSAALGCVLALAVAALMHHQHAGLERVFSGPEDPYLKGLARHLEASDAKFFGASWCPHCQQQKVLFGAAAKFLPYVECSPNGPRAPQATDCLAHNITGYPTWIVAERLYPTLLSIEKLARLTGYQAPGYSD